MGSILNKLKAAFSGGGRDDGSEKKGEPGKGSGKSGARGFFRSSLIYGLGDLLTKGARIILIPYFIAYLTKPEVGLLAILQAIIFATWVLLSFGFGHAVQRFYDQYGETSERFTTTLWLTRILVALPFYAALMFSVQFFAGPESSGISLELLWLALTAGFFRSVFNITELWFIIREKPVSYRTFTFCMFLTTTLLTIYFITFRGMGVKGAMLAELISYAFWAVVSGLLHFRAGMPQAGLIRWKESLSYCLPVLPHALFMWALAGADRLLLAQHNVSKEDIGEYFIGYMLASVISVGALAIRAAWLPAFFKQKDQVKGRAAFGRTASIYFYYLAFAAVAAIAFAPEAIALFSGFGKESYSQSVHILRIIAISMIGYATFLGLNQPLFYERRIAIIALTSGVGLALNIGLNYLLIPTYGIFGSALATVGSYSAIGAIVMVTVTRMYGIKWQNSRLAFFAVAAVAAGLIVLLIPNTIGWWQVALKTLLILAFVGVTLFKMGRDESSRLRISSRFEWLKQGGIAG